MALGFFSGKAGAFSGENARTLNKVVLNYALPAALFISIIKANRSMLSADIKLTIISFVVLMACFFLVYFVFKYFYKDTTGEAAVSALISGSSDDSSGMSGHSSSVVSILRSRRRLFTNSL